MEYQASGGCRRVDVLGHGTEPGTTFADSLHDLQKVFEGPGQAVVLGDSHNVAVAELVQHPVQLGPRALRSANLVRKYLTRSRRRQGVGLGIQVLVVRTDSGVSDDHTALWQKPARTAKVLRGVCVIAKSLILRGAERTGGIDHFRLDLDPRS